MQGPDLYAVLGVSPWASTEEIVDRYRARLRKEHPDTLRSKLTGPAYDRAAATWARVGEAYNTLKDPESRSEYDAKLRGSEPKRRPTRARGLDHHNKLAVPFMTALKGGRVAYGKLEVQIPIGITHGKILKLPGRGGSGDPPGDLYLTVEIEPHPILRRDDDGVTLLMDLPVTWHEAYRRGGGPLDVPTPWGFFPWRYSPGEIVDGLLVEFEGYGVRFYATDRRHRLRATVRLVPPPPDDLALQQVLQRLQEMEAVRAEMAAALAVGSSRMTADPRSW